MPFENTNEQSSLGNVRLRRLPQDVGDGTARLSPAVRPCMGFLR